MGILNDPVDVAFDSKNQRLLVANRNNHRIEAFDLKGTFLFTFGSQGKRKREFNAPWGIATDRAGNFFVSDHDNHRVQVFDGEGNFIRKFGSKGSGQGQLKYPSGIGVLSNGYVVVADRENKRLSVFGSQGQIIRIIGKDKLVSPRWLFIDSHDNILVTDNGYGNKSLLVFSKEGNLLKEIGQGVFRNVWGVVKDRKGDIFVSGRDIDEQYRIFVF